MRVDENDCSGYSADDLTLVLLHLGEYAKLSLERYHRQVLEEH